MNDKLLDKQFIADIRPLMSSSEAGGWNIIAAKDAAHTQLICRLPGAPWEGSG